MSKNEKVLTQAPPMGTPGVHWECDCVPDEGPSHCHDCGGSGAIAWSQTFHGRTPRLSDEIVSTFKEAWEAADAAGMPDRSRHGLEAVFALIFEETR